MWVVRCLDSDNNGMIDELVATGSAIGDSYEWVSRDSESEYVGFDSRIDAVDAIATWYSELNGNTPLYWPEIIEVVVDEVHDTMPAPNGPPDSAYVDALTSLRGRVDTWGVSKTNMLCLLDILLGVEGREADAPEGGE